MLSCEAFVYFDSGGYSREESSVQLFEKNVQIGDERHAEDVALVLQYCG
jgi:hypothetical protein